VQLFIIRGGISPIAPLATRLQAGLLREKPVPEINEQSRSL